jgi:hypothetical protein
MKKPSILPQEVIDRLKAISPLPFVRHVSDKIEIVRRWIKPRHVVMRRWCKNETCRRMYPDRPADIPLNGKRDFCSWQCKDKWDLAHYTFEDLNHMIRSELEECPMQS